MTPLECLVLGLIFDAEPNGEGVYFYAELGPNDIIGLPIADLRAALAASAAIESRLAAYIAEGLAAAPQDDTAIDVDFGGPPVSWDVILQDIVRRSAILGHVTAVTAFTCTKMRPDGFGGMAMLITAEAIKAKSTEDVLDELLGEAEPGPLAAPGFGVHVLLRLEEAAVRAQIPELIEADETLTMIAAEAVTDADIRGGCLLVVDRTDLTEERDLAVFKAALAAIDEAERRRSA
jgi:hypothetical protein